MDRIAALTAQLKSQNKNKRFDACEELRVAAPIPAETLEALRSATLDPDKDVAERARLAVEAHLEPGSITSQPLLPYTGSQAFAAPDFIKYIDPRRIYNPSIPAGRVEFIWIWLFYPPLVAVLIIAALTLVWAVIDFISQTPPPDTFLNFFGWIFWIAWFIASVLAILRRLKDLGKSSVNIIWAFIPIANLILFIQLVFGRGAPVANRS